MKTCAKCKLSRPLDDFHNDRRHKDGKNIWCKSCKDAWTRSQGKPFDPNEDEQQSKVCYTCKRTLRLSDFHRDKRRPDGRAPNCKECVHTTYLRSGLQRPRDHESRICPQCGVERMVSDFPRDRSRADGIGVRCKPCGKAHYAANAASIQQKHREWKDRNYHKMAEYWRDRGESRFFYARAKNHCGSGANRVNLLEKTVELARLWKTQRGVCVISGRRLDRSNAQLDHIVPKSKGGADAVENLRWVHRDVNYAKRDLTDEAFLRLCSDVVNQLAHSGVAVGLDPSSQRIYGRKYTVDQPEIETLARLSNQPVKNGVNSVEAYRHTPTVTPNQAAKAEGVTTIPQGSRAKRPEVPRVPLGR